MEILILLRDLLNYRELLGAFLFAFFILSFVFKDPKTVAKVLRKGVILYAILIIIITYIK